MNDQGSGIGEQGSGAPRKKRRWIPILLGVLVLFGVIAIGAIALTVSWFRQNLTISKQVGTDAATQQFEAIRQRYPGQQPLIRLVDGKPQYVADRASQSSTQTSLTTLHVLAFDQDENQTVSFSLPFWILRMKSGPIRISAYQQGWDDRGVSFKVEDIEKHGPGIIVDATEPNEGRVLIWAE